MVSKLQYKAPSSAFTKELALRNLCWYLAHDDLIKAEELGSHTHTIDRTIDMHTDDFADRLDALLKASKSHFLGTYVEQLWRHYIEMSDRYCLLEHNLQIHVDGKTLGEFDFIVKDRTTGQIIHQEIAAKFYLALPAPERQECLWFGPNNRDRLDKKTSHLASWQLRLGEKQVVKKVLGDRNIQALTTQCILRGRLFLPWEQELRAECLGLESSTRHVRKDFWMTLSQFRKYLESMDQNTLYWLLEKHQWLSLYTQESNALSVQDLLVKLEEHIALERRGVLLKIQSVKSGEASAIFVVHDEWQQVSYDSLENSSEKPLQP